ncbi:MAG: 5-carboxymethyl-2-hydroxymuconate isomerase [Pseudomonadota bacterium]
MPHIVIEHSPRLEASHDLQGLCDALWDTFASHPEISAPDTVRVRTIASTASRTGVEPQSFAHATLLLLPGRDEATRRELAELVLNTLDEFLYDVGSLTVRVDHLEAPYIKRVLTSTQEAAHG